MAFKDPSRCPGCGRRLGEKKTVLPVPSKPEEKVRENGSWYCGRCGWELRRYSGKTVLIPPVVCPGCAKKIVLPWKVHYAAGQPCCADCQTELFEAAENRKAQEAEQAKERKKQVMEKIAQIQAAEADSPDRVTLIKRPCSHGDALLDTLILLQKENVPTVRWSVSWRGGYSHADGAGDDTPLPKDMLAELTPETLTEWLSKQPFGNLQDMAEFRADQRVGTWCSRVRSRAMTPEKLFDRYAADHPEAIELKQHITFTEKTASVNLLPGGYPLLEHKDLSWSLTGSRDDMRGPQVRRGLSEEEAIRLFIRLLRNPPDGRSLADENAGKKAAPPEPKKEDVCKSAFPRFTGIEQAAAYSKIETDMHPGGISKYSRDSDHLVTLFHTDFGPKGWGISNCVVVDDRTDSPLWISTQYDGGIAAQTWYLDRRQITFGEVKRYARDISPELYECVKDISSEKWRQCAARISQTAK